MQSTVTAVVLLRRVLQWVSCSTAARGPCLPPSQLTSSCVNKPNGENKQSHNKYKWMAARLAITIDKWLKLKSEFVTTTQLQHYWCQQLYQQLLLAMKQLKTTSCPIIATIFTFLQRLSNHQVAIMSPNDPVNEQLSTVLCIHFMIEIITLFPIWKQKAGENHDLFTGIWRHLPVYNTLITCLLRNIMPGIKHCLRKLNIIAVDVIKKFLAQIKYFYWKTFGRSW